MLRESQHVNFMHITCLNTLFIFFGLLFLMINAEGQDIGQISNQKPLVLSGSAGLSLTEATSSNDNPISEPFAWSFNAEMNINFYGIITPLNVLINQKEHLLSHPFNQFGLSPYYKWIKIHAGYRSIDLSPFAFSGTTFFGGGIELTPGKWKFVAFKGRLSKAMNGNPYQYKRKGYGGKIEYGNDTTHISLSYFHAKDDAYSIDTIPNYTNITPGENAVVGLSGKFTCLRIFHVNADYSVSGFTPDTRIASGSAAESGFGGISLFLKPHYNSYKGNAMKVGVDFMAAKTNINVGFKYIDNHFRSLGISTTTSGLLSYDLDISREVFKGKVFLMLNSNYNRQYSDMEKRLINRNLNNNLNVNYNINQHLSANLNLMFMTVSQKAGSESLQDSIKINEHIFNGMVMPRYVFRRNGNNHSVLITYNYQQTKDQNEVIAPYTDNKNRTIAGNYSVQYAEKKISISFNAGMAKNKNNLMNAASFNGGVGASKQFLENGKLSTSGNINLRVNKFNGNANGSGISLCGNVNYSQGKNNLSGSFSLVSSKSKYQADKNTVETKTSSVFTTQVNLGYVHSF